MQAIDSLDHPEWCPLVPAVPLEDYQSMERTVVKLTQALNNRVTVKHGRWLYNKLWGTECSECGYAMFELVGVRYTTCKPKYCPHCGAKMDEPAMEEQKGASNEEKI